MLQQLGAHTFALLVYPGLLAVAVLGAIMEVAWTAIAERAFRLPTLSLRRPAPSLVIGSALGAMAASQLAAPFNFIPAQERNLLIALAALAFMQWTSEQLPEEAPLLLIAQLSWVVAVLGTAVEPQSLRPSVLGATLVQGLIPLKLACGLLYLLCLPVLLRIAPQPQNDGSRTAPRYDGARALLWFPYIGLFATLYFPPPTDDFLGGLRFAGLTMAAAFAAVLIALLLRGYGQARVPALYRRVIGPFAGVVLLLAAATALIMR